MIISKTPIRLTLFGGGTDYPIFFEKYGGETLGFAINKYSYVIIKENSIQNQYKYFLSYKNTEMINKISKIEHPSIRETLKFMKIDQRLEIHYTGDIPAKTGLGSSSSFTVGLLKSLYAFKKKIKSNTSIAKEAIYIEQKMIKENVGCQDQLSTAIGGILNIKYSKNNFLIRKVRMDKSNTSIFEKSIILFYTGIDRFASKSIEKQLKDTAKNKNIDYLFEMKNHVTEAKKILGNKINIKALGELMNNHWQIKKELSNNVSNNKIDEIYHEAIKHGAYGGKLVGAGAGGFLMFICNQAVKDKLKSKFYKLQNLEIKVDNIGSSLVLK